MYRIVSLAAGLAAAAIIFLALLTDAGATVLQKEEEGVIAALRPSEQSAAPEMEPMAFPIQVQGTSLTAEHLVSYEGPFLEDGTNAPVFDIAALMVCNTGQQEITQATITLHRGEETLTFCGSNILPGMRVMLLEQDQQPYTQENFTGCEGVAVCEESVTAACVQIEERGMGELIVTNPTRQVMTDITLYHKNWLPGDVYVGGITYTTKIDILQPGESITVKPEHYAAGYSKIIKISA